MSFSFEVIMMKLNFNGPDSILDIKHSFYNKRILKIKNYNLLTLLWAGLTQQYAHVLQ